jgi:phosphosulfolactate synthase
MMNFKLTHIPKRPDKPREKGLTMVMDKGLSLREAEDLIEVAGDKIDLLKLGFGTSYVTNNLAEKIKLFQANNIQVYPGGTLFEAFIARKKFGDFRRFLDQYNLDMCEVSDGSIVLDHDEKCEYVQKLTKDRVVLSEVGSKEQGILISPSKWIKMMQNELEAGSWKVIAEGRESGSVGIFRPNGTPHTILINKIIAKIPPDKILWEAPGKKQQVWFINIFGANVSLGNIAPSDVIPLECLRLGLRGDTFFNYLPDNIIDDLQQPEGDHAKARQAKKEKA